jgi:hypothetical protein
MAGQPRISYVQPAQMNDPAMLAELDRCRKPPSRAQAAE